MRVVYLPSGSRSGHARLTLLLAHISVHALTIVPPIYVQGVDQRLCQSARWLALSALPRLQDEFEAENAQADEYTIDIDLVLAYSAITSCPQLGLSNDPGYTFYNGGAGACGDGWFPIDGQLLGNGYRASCPFHSVNVMTIALSLVSVNHHDQPSIRHWHKTPVRRLQLPLGLAIRNICCQPARSRLLLLGTTVAVMVVIL